MSYILDALRKAEAERERGSVPGIHAQPMFPGASASAPARNRPWIALLGTAVVVLAAAVLWMVFGSNRAARDAATTVAVAPPTMAVPAAPAPMPTTPPASVMPPAAPVVTPPPVARTAPVVARKPKPAASASTDPAGAVAQPGATPATAGASSADSRVYAVAELPDDIRRQLPNVTIGGSMYSPKPADRILIINGQVVHEGDRITPNLVLQQIRLKAALLNFKGYRYTLNF